jgi:hypothetical protein
VIRLGGSGPFQTDFKGALILLRGGVSFRFVGEEECCAGIRFGDSEEECCVTSCAGVRFGVVEGGGVGCSLLPACRWPSSSESESVSQNRPCRGGSGHWPTSSVNCFIRRRLGRWVESFTVTARSLLRIDDASKTGIPHGRGGGVAKNAGGWLKGWRREPTAIGPPPAGVARKVRSWRSPAVVPVAVDRQCTFDYGSHL